MTLDEVIKTLEKIREDNPEFSSKKVIIPYREIHKVISKIGIKDLPINTLFNVREDFIVIE